MDDFDVRESENDAARKSRVEFVQFLMLRAADYRDAGDLESAGEWRDKGLRQAFEFDVSADDEMDGRARGLFGPLWRARR